MPSPYLNGGVAAAVEDLARLHGLDRRHRRTDLGKNLWSRSSGGGGGEGDAGFEPGCLDGIAAEAAAKFIGVWCDAELGAGCGPGFPRAHRMEGWGDVPSHCKWDQQIGACTTAHMEASRAVTWRVGKLWA